MSMIGSLAEKCQPIEQIRQDYREAVASAIEGKDNIEAWNRVSKSLANAIFSAWLSSAAKTAQGIPECEITKMFYAKSDCGAGDDNSQGFQPGNTCAGEGGSRERQRVTRNELTEPEQAIVSAMVESGSAEDSVQALYRSEEDAIDFILDNYEDITYDEEGNGLIKWREDGKKTINALKDYWYTRTQEFIEKKFGDVDTITMYRGDYSDRHGTYETPQFVSTDKSTAEFYTTSDLGSHSGRERKVVEYEVPVEDILMCQECLPGQFAEDAFLVPPEILNSGDEGGGGKQTTTPEFKNWFGDSQVINDAAVINAMNEGKSITETSGYYGEQEKGEPLVMYHGTTADFDEFDVDKQGSGLWGNGFYFALDPDIANAFTESRNYAYQIERGREVTEEHLGGNIKPVYVKIEKPVNDAEEPIENFPEDFIREYTESQARQSLNSIKYAENWLSEKDSDPDYNIHFDDPDITPDYAGRESMVRGLERAREEWKDNPEKDISKFVLREHKKTLGYGDIFDFYERKFDKIRKDKRAGKPEPQFGGWLGQMDTYEAVNELLKPLGYDGYIGKDNTSYDVGGSDYIQERKGGYAVMAFYPEQIKSSIGNKGDFDPDSPKMTNKRTFAKKKDAFDELFEIFDVEPSFEVGVNMEALADLEGRVPMVRSAVDQMDALAKSLAQELIVAERAGILPFMESTSKGVQAALKKAFWVSDVDHNVVVNIKNLLAGAIRGVMPDKSLSLPDFISLKYLSGAANLTDARLETIYRTNISTAANEGVMSILRDPEAKDLFPLVMITEIDDDRSRPHHAAMDGYITTPGEMDRLKLRPPNGYNCRGSLIKVAWEEANELGLLDDMGIPDMISIKRHNSPEQEGLIAAGKYPDEGFKRGGFFNEV